MSDKRKQAKLHDLSVELFNLHLKLQLSENHELGLLCLWASAGLNRSMPDNPTLKDAESMIEYVKSIINQRQGGL